MPGNKKILILIEWFVPGYKAGGPIQSCVNLCLALKDSYDIYVLTTDTDHGDALPYPAVTTNEWITEPYTGVQVYYAKKKLLSFNQIATVIDATASDFVYLNLFFSPHFILYPLWLKFSGKMDAKLILCPRGTLYDSAISLKWYIKKPFLRLVRWLGIHNKITFHATNQREEIAIRRYFPKVRAIIADNLPNTLQPAFVTCAKIAGSLRCIFIARIVPIKNLLFLLQLLKMVPHEIELTVVGPAENESYWKICQEAIGSLPANIKIEYAGSIENNKLPGLLQQHHLFILPTTGENFGHAIFEALLAGRPVLISDQTPWLDMVQHNAGWAIPLADEKKYIEVINYLAESNQDGFDKYAVAAWHYANNFIHNPLLTEQYKKLFS